jgi:hypothetical protein
MALCTGAMHLSTGDADESRRAHAGNRLQPQVRKKHSARRNDLREAVQAHLSPRPVLRRQSPGRHTVYGQSHYFQGYIAQGLKSFFRPESAHYLFVADDLILNPAISADTYAQVLKLDADSSFIPELLSIPQPSEYWSHNRNGLRFDAFRTEGMEVRGEVPDAAEAAERLRRHGVFGSSFTFAQVYGAPAPAEGVRARLRHLRAASLFAELAIPTALVLAADKIVTEQDLALRGKALWTQEQLDELNPYCRRLGRLLRGFPADYLYLHPVKLSQWTAEDL